MYTQTDASTPFADVNVVLNHFLLQTQTLLAHHFLGMYLVGSLALGDFDPCRSDIDFVVLTDTDLHGDFVQGLREIHTQFDAGATTWAAKIEAIYVPPAALHAPPPPKPYPQIERGASLVETALEPGWVFQCWTLRERTVVVAGPQPRTLIVPIRPQEMYTAVMAIAAEWQQAARTDPSWLAWLQQRPHHTFVMQTLCRLLYALEMQAVCSKPQALQWAQDALAPPWAVSVQTARRRQHEATPLTPSESKLAKAFIDYTVAQAQNKLRPLYT